MHLASRQLLRAVRGARTQRAFARQLGFSSNVCAEWESGRRSPSGPEFIRLSQRLRLPIVRALRDLEPGCSVRFEVDGLPAWLSALRGRTSQTALAVQTGFSRYQIHRWLGGRASPKLAALLILLDTCTGRVPELIDQLVGIDQVPALRERFIRQLEARDALRKTSQAALARLTLHAGSCSVSALATRLQMTPDAARGLTDHLVKSGRVRLDGDGVLSAVGLPLPADVRKVTATLPLSIAVHPLPDERLAAATAVLRRAERALRRLSEAEGDRHLVAVRSI